MVAVVDPLELVVVAFAGGAFGAAVGALEAFSLAGVLVVVGEAVDVAADGLPGPSGDPAALGSSGLTALTGLGPLFGPHVAFAGGAAATAFAARQGYLDSDFDYHEAKHVTAALGPRADVMAVGGAFGVVGVGLVAASVRLGLPFDPISFGIVVSGLLHRLVLGFPLIGTVRGETPLDMTPYERRIRRPPRADGGDTRRRFAVEPWLPGQSDPARAALLGAVVGVVGAFLTFRTGSPFLAFGLAAATLLFHCAGVERVPVTHHAALVSSLAVVGLAGGAATPAAFAAATSLAVALLVGAVFGAVTALAAELAQRLLYAHADTHLDPPAVGILVGTSLVVLLDLAGVFQQSLLPTLGL
ncbi:hypothetical protein BRD02_10705 [Halobacteriales archaeon QS_8_69_73]|nr:MAG: hypothetical protein BRD02_10705 [Halobacteriales archaeon QS_8_69_73]